MTTRDEITTHLQKVWEQKPHNKINWLSLETTIRETLRAYAQYVEGKETIDSFEALELIDEALAAYTGRGNELGGTQ